MNQRTPKTTGATIRSCPFCGGEAVFGQIGFNAGTPDAGDDPKPLLSERWNRRASGT